MTGVLDRAFAANAAAFRRRELPRSCLLRLAFDEAPGPPGAEEPPAGSAPKRPDGNYFVRLKKFWAVRYGNGEENIYPTDRGFEYLRILLEKPNTRFKAAELAGRIAARETPRCASLFDALEGGVGVNCQAVGDDVLDDDAVQALNTRLEKIRELRAALPPDRVEDHDELEVEEQQIIEHLERAQGIGVGTGSSVPIVKRSASACAMRSTAPSS
jgi:hypothetical protein